MKNTGTGNAVPIQRPVTTDSPTHDLGTNVAALLRLISHYRLTGDIKKNNATLLKTIGSQIGTDCFGKPLADGDARLPGAEISVAVPVARPNSPNLEIYTDGSCCPNPGLGGWGLVVVEDGHVVERLSGGERDTTNNRMEFRAAIEALKWLDQDKSATIYTDSQLVVKILSRSWRAKSNLDLVTEARRLMRDRNVEFRWVRGHNGNRFNEESDALARCAVPGNCLKKRKARRLQGRKKIVVGHADLRRRAALDRIPFDDSLPAHLIP